MFIHASLHQRMYFCVYFELKILFTKITAAQDEGPLIIEYLGVLFVQLSLRRL